MEFLGGVLSAIVAAVVGVVVTWSLGRVDQRNQQRHKENQRKFDEVTLAQKAQAETLGQISERVSFIEGKLGIPIRR